MAVDALVIPPLSYFVENSLMSRSFQVMSVLLLFVVGSIAHADCDKCEKSANSSAVTADATCEGGTCPITKAMEALPKMSYAVGDDQFCCPTAAGEMAKQTGGHIHYVVAEKQFDSKAEAQMALVEATEKFVADFAEPHTCPNSGKVTVAGEPQHCMFEAGALAKKMNAAMDEVKMTYLVGETTCSCPMKAGALAKEQGAEKQFVVGDTKTCCEHTARLNLARAKYKAAVKVLADSKAAQAEATAEQGT